MSRKTAIALCCLALTLPGVVTAASAAAATGGTAAPAASDTGWCTGKGGKAVDYSPWYNINGVNPTRLGGRQRMCDFSSKDGSSISVAADSLAADRPTMAMLAYIYKPSAPDSPGGGNPSDWYCSKIGGTVQFGSSPLDVGGWAPSGQSKPRDFVGMCVFADRSMIDTWGLFYHKGGIIRGADLTRKWKAKLPAR